MGWGGGGGGGRGGGGRGGKGEGGGGGGGGGGSRDGWKIIIINKEPINQQQASHLVTKFD